MGTDNDLPDAGIRERIIKAALHLFAVEGFHAVPVPRIADKAGVGVGSIYRVAPSKVALADLVFDDCVERLKQAVFLPRHDDGLEGRELFIFYWRRVSAWLLADAQYMRFMVLYRFIGPAARKSGLRRAGMMEAMVQTFIARGWVKEMSFDVAASLISGPLVVMTLDKTLREDTLETAGEAIWRALKAD